MTVLTRLTNKIFLIDKNSSAKFINDFNKNKVSHDFLKSCKKAGRLFENRRSGT